MLKIAMDESSYGDNHYQSISINNRWVYRDDGDFYWLKYQWQGYDAFSNKEKLRLCIFCYINIMRYGEFE